MEETNNNLPLVSIIVVAYNSSKYVLETLESAWKQTYKNIELIVTDDGSTDNTVDICQKWIANNNERFVRTQLVTSERNTGIAPNANRGFNAAKGKWIKFIAGDDILLASAIGNFIEYCQNNRGCKILFGRMYYMKNNILNPKPIEKIALVNPKKQKKLVYLGSSLPAPAVFTSRNLIEILGGFDERYLYIDDLPFWIKVANNNIQIHFINKFVVKYRIHHNNICQNNSRIQYMNKKFYVDHEKIILRELFPYYAQKLYIGQLLHYTNYIIINRLILFLGNKYNFISNFLNLLIIKTTIKRSINMILQLVVKKPEHI